MDKQTKKALTDAGFTPRNNPLTWIRPSKLDWLSDDRITIVPHNDGLNWFAACSLCLHDDDIPRILTALSAPAPVLTDRQIRLVDWVFGVSRQTLATYPCDVRLEELAELQAILTRAANNQPPADAPTDSDPQRRSAKQFIHDGLIACLPPGVPLMGEITKARFFGKNGARGTLTLFDGETGEVEVTKSGQGPEWMIRWLNTGGTDFHWDEGRWQRIRDDDPRLRSNRGGER